MRWVPIQSETKKTLDWYTSGDTIDASEGEKAIDAVNSDLQKRKVKASVAAGNALMLEVEIVVL